MKYTLFFICDTILYRECPEKVETLDLFGRMTFLKKMF